MVCSTKIFFTQRGHKSSLPEIDFPSGEVYSIFLFGIYQAENLLSVLLLLIIFEQLLKVTRLTLLMLSAFAHEPGAYHSS